MCSLSVKEEIGRDRKSILGPGSNTSGQTTGVSAGVMLERRFQNAPKMLSVAIKMQNKATRGLEGQRTACQI